MYGKDTTIETSELICSIRCNDRCQSILCSTQNSNDSQNAPPPFISSDQSKDISLPSQSQDNHTPLRLNGGGDKSSESHERVNSEHLGNSMQTSLSVEDIRDVLFEAGYTIDEIENVLAANIEAGLSDLYIPTVCAESDMSGSDLVSGESDNSLSDSGTENAYDTLKEIRVKNVNKVVIGTLNIN